MPTDTRTLNASVQSTVTLAFYIIIACIPLLFLLDSDASTGIALVALSLALPASHRLLLVTRESLFRSILTPVLFLLAVPACYLVFQMFPIPGISNPAWQSAASAQGIGLIGPVTLDIGMTFLALAQYGVFCGMLFLSMIVAMTRGRAERVFVAILISLTISLMVHLFFRFHSLSSALEDGRSVNYSADEGLLACAGLILSLVFAIHLVGGQLKMQKNSSGTAPSWHWFLLGTSVSIALLSLVDLAKTALFIASGFGCAALILVVLVRRLGGWAGGALAVTACIVVVMLVANSATISSTMESTLKFGPQPQAVSATVARMLEDLPVFGTGAATFNELYKLYGIVDADNQQAIASTPLSAVLAVEFGEAAFLVAICLLLAAAIFFLVSAVLRGRDWIYPAACAALICVWVPLCFGTPIRGHLDALTIGAAMLGLGIAQSRSRHSEQ